MARRCGRCIARIQRECGRLDIVVNNAGVNTLKDRVTIDQFSRDEWDRVLKVDLTACSRSVAWPRDAEKAGPGRIINIASIAGLVPLRLQCAFVAAKAGVVNLTKVMALDWARRDLGERHRPGSTLTEGTRKSSSTGKRKVSLGQTDARPYSSRPGLRDPRNRRRRPLSGRPRKHVHERPRPRGRRRLDRRLPPRVLRV